MRKRLLVPIICFLLIFSNLSVLAGVVAPKVEYPTGYFGVKYKDGEIVAGEEGRLVGAESFCTEKSSNATESNSGIEIASGGAGVWGFYLPYSSRAVKITYSCTEDAEIELETEENSYGTIALQAGQNSAAEIKFGDKLGYDDQYRIYNYHTNYDDTYGFKREYVEHLGEKEISINNISDEPVIIQSIYFEKEKVPVNITTDATTKTVTQEWYQPQACDYTMEALSSVLIHEDANIIIANGGRRYIDNDNVSLRPYNIKGSLYLPINTLAKALGYYCEDIPEKGYALMRSETHEVVLMGDKCTVSEGVAEPRTVSISVFAYHNGQTFAAVRYFAELLGKTVGYKDGLVAIDDKYTVSNILYDDTVRAYTEQGSSYEGSFYDYADGKFEPFKRPMSVGNTYYVAENGKDSNTGSELSPWSLEKAMNAAEAGDTVILKGGTYREILKPLNDGAADAPITFKAAEGEKVIISAAEQLGTLVRDNDFPNMNVYKTAMAYTMGDGTVNEDETVNLDGRDQIFVDGVHLTEARYPDGPGHLADGRLSNAWGVRGDIYKTKSVSTDEIDTTTFYSDYLFDQSDDYWVGGTYVGMFGSGYALTSGKITDSASGSITIGDSRLRNQKWSWEGLCRRETVGREDNEWNFGMIVGHINAMSVPGEWVRTQGEGDEGTLHIVLPDSINETNADELKVEAKRRQQVIDLSDRKYINVEGIETIAGGITLDNSEMCMLNGMNMKYISHYTLNSDNHSGYIDLPYKYKKGAPQRGEVGVYLGGKDNIVVNSRIDHSAGAGLYITGAYAYIENNILNDCGYMGSFVSGIHIDTVPWEYKEKPLRGGYAIYNNTVYNTGRAAIDFSKSEYVMDGNGGHTFAPYLPSDIAYNDFHDNNLTAYDTGAVYSNGTNGAFDKKSTNVRYNYIYKTTTSPDRNHSERALYWDGYASGYDSFGNLMFDTGGEAFVDGYDFLQLQLASKTWERLWNNQRLGHIDTGESEYVADALLPQYFSEDKPFYAGSLMDRDGKPYLVNYNRFKKGTSGIEYKASEFASKSENTVINAQDGYAEFGEDGDWLIFENVDFGTDAKNEIVFSYKCDSNYTYDEVALTITEEDGTTNTYSDTLNAQDPPTKDEACTHRISINPTSGKCTVKIEVKKLYSIKIGGFSLYKRVSEYENEDFAHFEYISDYTDYQYSGTIEGYSLVEEHTVTYGNPLAHGVSNIRNALILRYANQKITESSSKFIISAFGNGQKASIYIKEHTDEFASLSGLSPNASVILQNKNNYDFTPLVVSFDGIEAGTYDIYIKFGQHIAGKGSKSTALYFGFLKGETTADYYTQPRYAAGGYNSDESIQDEEHPFETQRMERKDFLYCNDAKKLLYAKSGTTAAYTDIDTTAVCNKIRVAYYMPLSEYCGQEINITVSKSDGTIVTTGKIAETTASVDGKFTEEVVTLSSALPATIDYSTASYDGGYTVKFEFDGSSEKLCQLGWFRFE